MTELPPATDPESLFLVTGPHGGREVFLGRPIPGTDAALLEGKALAPMPHGRLIVRPFETRLDLEHLPAGSQIHHVTTRAALTEARGLLELTATHLSRAAVPHVFAWVETALTTGEDGDVATEESEEADLALDPLPALFERIVATADGFRRLLYRHRQVEDTRALDQVTELVGDLRIELGKLSNRAAVRLHHVLQRERVLAEHLEALDAAPPTPSETGTGWGFVHERLRASKDWARAHGETELVGELHGILRETSVGLQETLLEHEGVLDALIAETLAPFGISGPLELPTVEIPRPARHRTAAVSGA